MLEREELILEHKLQYLIFETLLNIKSSSDSVKKMKNKREGAQTRNLTIKEMQAMVQGRTKRAKP